MSDQSPSTVPVCSSSGIGWNWQTDAEKRRNITVFFGGRGGRAVGGGGGWAGVSVGICYIEIVLRQFVL